MMFADAPPMKAYSMSTTATPVSEFTAGFSGFTTWTRGLAWGHVRICEELEWLDTVDEAELKSLWGKKNLLSPSCWKAAKLLVIST